MIFKHCGVRMHTTLSKGEGWQMFSCDLVVTLPKVFHSLVVHLTIRSEMSRVSTSQLANSWISSGLMTLDQTSNPVTLPERDCVSSNEPPKVSCSWPTINLPPPVNEIYFPSFMTLLSENNSFSRNITQHSIHFNDLLCWISHQWIV